MLEALMVGDGPPGLDALGTARPSWMADGACRGQVELCFVPSTPTRSERPPVRLAAVCSSCLVREECLAYAVEDPELLGCWGGTTERQRRAMRQRPAA